MLMEIFDFVYYEIWIFVAENDGVIRIWRFKSFKNFTGCSSDNVNALLPFSKKVFISPVPKRIGRSIYT